MHPVRILLAILLCLVAAFAWYALELRAERDALRDYTLRAVEQAEQNSLITVACLAALVTAHEVTEDAKSQAGRAWNFADYIVRPENRCPEDGPPFRARRTGARAFLPARHAD